MRFADRTEAGRKLAALLSPLREQHPVVLALPRGGLPVGLEVARALGAPLEVLVVRKLTSPLAPELGFGAVAEAGACSLDPDTMRALRLSASEAERVAQERTREVERRAALYRAGKPPPDLRGRVALLVDDGIATGGTARAAVAAARALGAARVVLAAPIVAEEVAPGLREVADELVYVHAPERLLAVGYWYAHFPQLTDQEVLALLAQARAPDGPSQATG